MAVSLLPFELKLLGWCFGHWWELFVRMAALRTTPLGLKAHERRLAIASTPRCQWSPSFAKTGKPFTLSRFLHLGLEQGALFYFGEGAGFDASVQDVVHVGGLQNLGYRCIELPAGFAAYLRSALRGLLGALLRRRFQVQCVPLRLRILIVAFVVCYVCRSPTCH